MMRFVAHGIGAGALPSQGVVSPRLAAIALRLRKLNGTLSSESSEGTVSIQVKIPANASHPQIAA